MKAGETLHVVNNNILGLPYRDERDVFFLSTLHRPKLVATQKKDRDGNDIMKE